MIIYRFTVYGNSYSFIADKIIEEFRKFMPDHLQYIIEYIPPEDVQSGQELGATYETEEEKEWLSKWGEHLSKEIWKLNNHYRVTNLSGIS